MHRQSLRAIMAVVVMGATANALPKTGAARPTLTLADAWDRTYDLARAKGMPLLVVYEDKDSANQNDALKRELATLGKGDAYKKKIALVAIADVSAYDYWPARGFVKDAIQSESEKQGTTIYCDWSGGARLALGLERGASNVVLYDKDGKVLFAHAGPVPEARRAELIALLKAAMNP